MNYFGFMAFSFKLSATPLTEAWLSEGNKMKSTKLNNLLDITSSYMIFLWFIFSTDCLNFFLALIVGFYSLPAAELQFSLLLVRSFVLDRQRLCV